MRLIDADTFEVVTTKIPDGMDAESYMEGMVFVLNKIDDAPTVEPEDRCGECDAWNQYKNYPRQRWIPVTEQLPEDDSDILVTYVEKDEKRIAPVNYGCGTWFDCFFNKELNPVGVLAWMPLPEPYAERRTDEAD